MFHCISSYAVVEREDGVTVDHCPYQTDKRWVKVYGRSDAVLGTFKY
jgi:hypothetical protein